MLLRLDHPVQVRDSPCDVVVFVLRRPAFRRQNSAPVNIFEVSVGKFVRSFGILGLLVVDAQVPCRVFVKPVPGNKVVLVFCGGLVIAPGISFIVDALSLQDERFGVLQGFSVQFLLA